MKAGRRDVETEIVDAQHAQAEADLGANRIELESKASSVIENSVRRTGTTRLLLQTNSVSGCSSGMISRVPALAMSSSAIGLDGGIDQHLQLRQLGMQPELHGQRKCDGKFELVGGVEFGLDLDGFDRRPAQPQRVDANAVLPARRRLNLSVRDNESGLYCSAITLWITLVSGSSVTMPPLTRRGEIGDPLIEGLLLFVLFSGRLDLIRRSSAYRCRANWARVVRLMA